MLSATVHHLADVTGWSVRRAHKQHVMRIVMLHGITSDEASAFGRQLAWLRRHFEPVGLPELLARMDEPARVTGREVALTFDDGLRNNATVVAPLLREHGVSATFFVCPGLIEAGQWLWNHEARERLRTLDEQHRFVFGKESRLVEGPVIGPSAIVEKMKALAPDQRGVVATLLRKYTKSFQPSPDQRAAYDMMTWDELTALDPALITIGSHTLDHPILPTLDEAGIDAELAESRAMLEAGLGRPVPLFCYPNGAQDERVRAAARKHYDAAVTTVPGLVRTTDDRHGLPRIGATEGVAELAWRFHRP